MAKIVKIEGCIGCGACAGVAPDVFEINADGVAECIFGEEIADAYEYGSEIVKLFPAGNFGTSYVKAITAPISHIPLMAVGGVDLSNMKNYLNVGICSVGIGSSLTDKKLIDNCDWEALTNLAKEYVEATK